MRNLKSMYCEKNSDEIDHYKNFGHQKVFSIFIQKIYLFSSIFPQNFFNKRCFFSKILGMFSLKYSKLQKFCWKWAEDKEISGQKYLKNDDLQSFVVCCNTELVKTLCSMYNIVIEFSFGIFNSSCRIEDN